VIELLVALEAIERGSAAQEHFSNAFPSAFAPSQLQQLTDIRSEMRTRRSSASYSRARFLFVTNARVAFLHVHMATIARSIVGIRREQWQITSRFAIRANRQWPCRFFRTLKALAGTCNLESDTDARHWPIAT
jgi:hypothetical protein